MRLETTPPNPDGPFPPMTVLELAIANAIARDDPRAIEELRAILENWFQRPVSEAEVNAALGDLEEKGWMRLGERTAEHTLTPSGIDTVTALHGGCIRMIDRGLGLFEIAQFLSQLNRNKESDDD